MNVVFRARRGFAGVGGEDGQPSPLSRSIGNCLPKLPGAKEAGRNLLRPACALQSERELVRSHQLLIGKNSFEAAGFIVIVQHHDGNNAQGLLSGMTPWYFALQVL